MRTKLSKFQSAESDETFTLGLVVFSEIADADAVCVCDVDTGDFVADEEAGFFISSAEDDDTVATDE